MGVVVRQKKKGRGQPWWVFINHNGKRTSRKVGDKAAAEGVASTIRSKLQLGEFTKALEKAELRHIRMHDLRHTYASLRIAKGDNIQDVSRHLGHATVAFTLAVYAHWLPGQAKSQVDELDSKEAPKCTLSAPKTEIGHEKGVSNDC